MSLSDIKVSPLCNANEGNWLALILPGKSRQYNIRRTVRVLFCFWPPHKYTRFFYLYLTKTSFLASNVKSKKNAAFSILVINASLTAVCQVFTFHFCVGWGCNSLGIVCQSCQRDTVGPCTLAQSDHLWGLVVTKPVILSKKGINMTWCRYIGLQYIQRSAF